ncbi:hypothetical protein BKA15_001755 [Microlunatus parietis]|uniref:Uncharacterized protein n=1 Tax=Microlunatus parietis TaxID=682979 RepID=A0A7Y9LC26_9ACTN|nr:hypothetical protein [Microlunatus parietis]
MALMVGDGHTGEYGMRPGAVPVLADGRPVP